MQPQDLLEHHDAARLWTAPAPAFDDIAGAYRSNLAVRALRIARGEQPRGYKIGFTNRSIWPRYEVYAPIWGTVYDSTLSFCEGNGTLSIEMCCQPRIEPEAVFGLRRTPPAEAGLDELFDALDWVAPGFEIVQSHRADWKFTAAETVADGALHARLVVGPRRAVHELADTAAGLVAVLAQANVMLARDGHVVDRGQGAQVLDSPLHALRHFLGELRACPDATDLQPGDVVTTGTWTDAWPVRAGETWRADFDSTLPGLSLAIT